MRTPILETERIMLRPMKVSDAEAVFNNWAADSDVSKYLRWNTHQSIFMTIKWLTFEEEDVESESSYQWLFVNRENEEVFGSGGLSYNEEQEMFEIGYVVMKKYWNKGFATEASKAMVDFAVKTLNQSQVYARYAKENYASRRVLEKTGFVFLREGKYSSFDNKRVFECRECFFESRTQ